MNSEILAIRPFIGSKNFTVAASFYKELGFTESIISGNMSRFYKGAFSFYLQDAYIKEWIENTMVLLEVEDVYQYWEDLQELELHKRYDGIRLVPVQENDWGKECMLIDPSGILWHFASFK